MKRYNWLLLIFIVIFPYSKAIAKKITLDFWYAPFSPHIFQPLIADFHQKNPNIEIIVTNYPTDDMKATLIPATLKKEAPEIILIPNDFLGYQAAFQLGEIPQSWIAKSTSKKLINASLINQKQYAIPIYTGNHLLLFYNKSLIKTPASSWHAMKNQLPKLQAKSVKALAMRVNKMYWFISFLNAYNGFPIKKDNIEINIAATVSALKAFKRLISDKLTEANCNYDCVNSRFLKGEFAYAFNGLWAYQRYQQHFGENFGVAPLPSIDGLPIKSMSSAHVLAFPNYSSQSEKADAIKKFALFMQSDEVQITLYRTMHMIPANQKIRKNLKINHNEKVILEQFKNTIAMPPSPSLEALWDAMDVAVNLFLAGDLTAEQTAQFIKKQSVRELQRIKRLNNTNNNQGH